MANTILIKSLYNAAGVPAHGSNLKVAELAVNVANDLEANRGHVFLGVAPENGSEAAAGNDTASAYHANQSGGIVWIGAPILDEDNMASDDATKLATQQSIKKYVDDQITAGDLDVSSDSGSMDIDLDSDTMTFTGTDPIDTAASGTTLTISVKNASTSVIGAASFSSSDFDVSSGAVSIKDNSITLAYMEGLDRGHIIYGDSSGNPASLANSTTDGHVLTVSNSNGDIGWEAVAAAGVPTNITVADTTDTSSFVGLFESATGDLAPKTDGGLTYNAGTGMLTATGLTGPLTGLASTATKIASITNSNIVQLTAAQTLTNKTLTSPVLTTPALGTPASGVLSSCTALPAAQVSQGTMASGMVLVAPVLGTPASGTLTNCTFPTANINTDVNVSAANLKTVLAAYTSSDTIYIGDADDDATIVIRGTLQVDGTTTTINSATLTVDDKLIVIADGAANDAAADGAGIHVDGSDAKMLYEATGDQWEFNKEVNCTSGFVGDLTGDVTGNADTATTATVGTSITAAANNSTDETVYITFVDGATGTQGIETDTGLTYNPSSGIMTGTRWTGAVTGAVTGTVSGNAGTVTNGVYTTSKISVLAATSSAELAGVISNETGSGSLVFATSPTLVTPALGTPASGVLTNCTALPAAQVAQGTMASGMVLVAPVLGTPASGALTNCTALPAAQVSQGTMASGMVLVAPVLGTPASGNLANCTALRAAQVTAGTMQTGMTLVAPNLGTPATFIIECGSYTPV